MSPRVLYLIVILGLWSRGEALQSCTPSCDGIQPGGHVPDPTNCRKYYICLANGKVSDFTEECPEGELFDSTENKCMVDGTCGLCEPVCKFSCPEPISNYEIVADRNDCSTFYICVEGNTPQPATCKADAPYFNGTSCTAEESQCCDGCIAYCSERYTQIPDPTNCTNFYFCEYEGYPEDTSLYQCAKGNFDDNAGVCSEEAACNQPCTDGGGGTTTTTTTTTTTAGNAAHCVDTFVCQTTGYFPRCTNRCDPHYYHCTSTDINHVVQATACSNNKVINPDTMLCVTQAECPYPLSSPHLYPPKSPPPPLFTQHSPPISTQISTPTSSHPFPTSSQSKTNKFIESPKDKF